MVTAELSDANFTGTILVPSNQSVTATSQAGAVATWSTPSEPPGCDAGQLHPGFGVDLPALHEHRDLPGHRRRRQCRHRDLRGHRAAHDPVVHSGPRSLRRRGSHRVRLTSMRRPATPLG